MANKCKKFSAKYKSGFREGFNNPTQYEKFLDKVLVGNMESLKEDKTRGIVAGYLRRKQEMTEGKKDFIWSDKDLNDRIC